MRGAAGQEGTAPGVGGGRKWHGAQPGGSAQKHGLGVSDYSRINQCHDRSQLLVQARTGRTGRKRAAPVVVAEDQMPSFPCRSPLTLPFAAPGRLFAPFSSAVPPLHSAQIPTGVLCTGEEPRTAGHGARRAAHGSTAVWDGGKAQSGAGLGAGTETAPSWQRAGSCLTFIAAAATPEGRTKSDFAQQHTGSDRSPPAL